jgi:16S rRNA (guanine527-N7)-methyltransferase
MSPEVPGTQPEQPGEALPRLSAGAFQSMSGASDAQMADLEAYRQALLEGNAVMNLVGPESMNDYWRRHVLDSWQLLAMLDGARRIADLGTGAGLPGVVLAIFMKGEPGSEILLVDSLAKRCRFLEGVVQNLALPARVVCARAEAASEKVDVITARACAPLSRLLTYAHPWMQKGAKAVFLKGARLDEELRDARKGWHLDDEVRPSLSDGRGQIVLLRSARRVR